MPCPSEGWSRVLGSARTLVTSGSTRSLERAFGPWCFLWPCTWAFGPGWYVGAPLALNVVLLRVCYGRAEAYPFRKMVARVWVPPHIGHEWEARSFERTFGPPCFMWPPTG